MKTIKINTSSKAYEIKLGKGIIGDCAALFKNADITGKIAVISDSNVAPLYLTELTSALKSGGYEVAEIVIPAGEEHKNTDTVNFIYEKLNENHITRKDVIAALGGGVVGDIAGFCAATYLRGIKYIQIPTTLLSFVDSSIGGKTGVDLKCGKNLVGAFKQPELVITDTSVLSTLDSLQIASGMAEVVKSGFIRDAELVRMLAGSDDFARDLPEFILHAITVKKNVVEADEFESGERMLLNFGHTFGHAIEKYMNFSGITHGQAVAYGMCLVTKSVSVRRVLGEILAKYDLKTDSPVPAETLVPLCRNDKKADGSGINIVLVSKIGNGETIKYSFEKFGEIYG